MITKLKRKYDTFSYIYPVEQIMMTKKQRQTLTELVYDRFQDEDTREDYLNQINDDLSYNEAQELILELSF